MSGYEGIPVLVLGAGGFIGRWVARTLAVRGAQVTCAVRDAERASRILPRFGVTGDIVSVDLGEPDQVGRLFGAVRPSITFNLAGYGVDRTETDAATSDRINHRLVGDLAELVDRYPSPAWPGLRLVHTGSALEYGPIGGHLDEEAVPNPTTLYGRTKLAGTRLLKGSQNAVTARLFTVYGPGEHPGRLLPSLLDVRTGAAPIPLSEGSQRRDFTYVEDVADGLARLGLQRSVGGSVLNLATGQLHSVREFVTIAAHVLHIPDGRLGFGALPGRTDEMGHDTVTVERLRQALGWIPATAIADGVARTQQFLANTDT